MMIYPGAVWRSALQQQMQVHGWVSKVGSHTPCYVQLHHKAFLRFARQYSISVGLSEMQA